MQLQNIKKLTAILVAVLFCHQSLFGQPPIYQPAGVETYVIKKEAVTDWSEIASLTNVEKVRSINYVDGLSRPIQSIIAAGSPNGKDIISFAKYDQYGRQVKQYLPYEAATSTGIYNPMATVEADQISFYNPANAPTKKIAKDNGPYYAESVFETSPLSRVINAGGVGEGYRPLLTNNHYKTLNYKNNTAADNVLKWTLGINAATSSGSSIYAADELTVSEVVDEHNITSKVFTDKFARVILKRQPGNHDTYYVYDNIGNIVFIIPPKAMANLTGGTTYTTSSVPDLIFQFWYDVKNRIYCKKVPGAAEVYMIYDPLGRVVLTQDGNMRNSSPKKWAYVKYDNANRVIIQGIYTNNNSLSAMQMDVDNDNCYSTGSYYEIRQSGTASGYSNQCFPASTTATEERGYNYYDDYDFDYDGNADYTKQNQGLTDEATSTNLTYGLPTGSKTKILGSGNPGTWLVNVNFYDKYYHVIQVRSNNQIRTTVTDHTTNVVNFSGQALQAKQVKTINDPNGITGTLEIEVNTRYEYDDMGRLVKVKQTNPGQSELIVAKYEYNALGQLVDKKLHSVDNGANYLQSVDMRYNLRGQLLSINNSERNINPDNNDESNDVFGMNILYDQAGSNSLGNTPYYNGMISAVKWSAGATGFAGNTAHRSYKYTYDNLYRLTAATYQEKKFVNWGHNLGGFNESISYDENGNITSLQRYAILSNAITQIDNLTYTYKNSSLSNQLEKVTDAIPNNTAGYGFRNFVGANPADPYIYDGGVDGNGNLTTDPKKGTTITYNELNKPTLIQISSTKKVEYRYDAAGTRISKYVYNNSSTPTKQIEYIGGYVIENEVLNYYSMAEGRVRNEGGGYGLSMKMEYFITDHQGNVRVSFEDNGTNTNTVQLTQENSYYAFGMQMASSYVPTNANKKLYNAGSEWQDDIDGLADYYSTFFREYDPVIGRFNGVDPKSESFESWTTYHYSYNNPINFNDPMGDDASYGQGSEFDLTGYMKDQYDSWHDSRYGNNLPDRGWNLGWDGGGGGGGGMSEFDALSTYEGLKMRQSYDPRGKFGYNAWGQYGYWQRTPRDYYGYLAPAEGNDFGKEQGLQGVGVTSDKKVWVALLVYNGSGRSGSDNLGYFFGSAGLATELTEKMISGANTMSNTVAKTKFTPNLAPLKNLSRAFGMLGVGVTIYEMTQDGVNFKNGTDMVFGIIALFPGPGWVIGGIYFVGDLIIKDQTGKHSGEHLGDAYESAKKSYDGVINYLSRIKQGW